MNDRDLMTDIVQFLKPYEKIWANEVLQTYPESLKFYPPQWIEQLNKLSKEELWKIDAQGDTSALQAGELKNYFATIKQLNKRVPFYSNTDNSNLYTDRDFFKVKGKKRHEIESITPIIDQLRAKYSFSKVIDIGGGQGHLPRIIASYHQLPATTIDYNITFQQSGAKKLCKYPSYAKGEKINYLHHNFGEDKDRDSSLMSENDLTIGLHTCGPLAIRHLEAFSKSNAKTAINFGCCYLRMESQTDTNLSKIAKKSGLSLNKFALNLATRSHAEMEYREFNLKYRVKQYRNMLHLLLCHKLDRWNFISVGDSPPRHYWGSFYEYVQEKFHFIQQENPLSQQEIEDFFADQNYQSIASKMFLADIIRWRLGRLLEIYILIDRVLWLKEKGQHVQLFQVFDETISPRNMAIVATKPDTINE